LFTNPSASFADVLLPAATAWETEALKPSFGGKGGTREAAAWAQLRKAVVPARGEARSDLALRPRGSFASHLCASRARPS